MWATFRKYPTPCNLIEFKRKCTLAQRTYKQAKQNLWQNYIATLNAHTPAKFVWDRLNKIRRNNHSFSLPDLCQWESLSSSVQTSKHPGGTFATCTGSYHYTPSFQQSCVGDPVAVPADPLGGAPRIFRAPRGVCRLWNLW